MIYCDHCVMPNTRPGIKFTKDKKGKNICSACINHKSEPHLLIEVGASLLKPTNVS